MQVDDTYEPDTPTGEVKNNTFQLAVDGINGVAPFLIDTQSSDTTEDLLAKIAQHTGHDMSQATLRIAGKVMEPGKSLSDYNVHHSASLKVKDKHI